MAQQAARVVVELIVSAVMFFAGFSLQRKIQRTIVHEESQAAYYRGFRDGQEIGAREGLYDEGVA